MDIVQPGPFSIGVHMSEQQNENRYKGEMTNGNPESAHSH